MSPRAFRAALVAVLVVSAALLFFRLGDRLLWQDEAETALLGRSVLVHGVPIAFDGKNLVSQEVGREFGPDHVWRWTPWLDAYAAAGSFAILGESTWSARLPFALIGLATVAALYPLSLLAFGDRRAALFATAFLATSVPFLLHARQCRYYAPLMLGTLGAFYFLLGMARGRRGAVAGFVVATTVVFHSNVLSFAATMAALVPLAGLLASRGAVLRRYAVAAGATALLNGPWAYYFLAGKSVDRISPVLANLGTYARMTSLYTLPGAAVVLFLAVVWGLRRRHPLLGADSGRIFAGLIVAPVIMIAVLSVGPWSFYRYTVGLLPVAALVLGFISSRLVEASRTAGTVLSAALLLTGVFPRLSALPFSEARYSVQQSDRSFPACDSFFPLGNYLYEVSRPFAGPMERLVAYVASHPQHGGRAFISYGDLVLMFYTDLEVRGGQSGRALDGWPPPDWVILRSFFRFGDRPALEADADRVNAWLKRLPRADYEEVDAPWTDAPWDDIPEPDLHCFRVPRGGKPMRIFRLRSSAGVSVR